MLCTFDPLAMLIIRGGEDICEVLNVDQQFQSTVEASSNNSKDLVLALQVYYKLSQFAHADCKRSSRAIALRILAAIYDNSILLTLQAAQDKVQYLYIYSVEKSSRRALRVIGVSEMQMYSVRTIAATPIPIEQFYVQQDSPLNQQQVMLLNKRVRYYVNVGSVVQAEGCFYLVALTQVDFASHIQRRLGIDSYFKSILCDAFNCSYDFGSLLLSNFSLLRCAGSQLANIPRFLSSSKFRIVRFIIAYLIALITFYLLYRFCVYYALQLRAASVRLSSRSLLLTTLQVTSILI